MSNLLTIKSRKTGEIFEFWMSDSGGYIRLISEKRAGVLGCQICENGLFMGSTLEATPENFESVCRNWYRAHMKKRNLYK